MPMTEAQAERAFHEIYKGQPLEEMCGPHILLGKRIWEVWCKKGNRLATRFLEEDNAAISHSFDKLEELVPVLQAKHDELQATLKARHEEFQAASTAAHAAEIAALNATIQSLNRVIAEREEQLRIAVSTNEKEAREFELQKQKAGWEQSNQRIILIAGIVGFFGGVFSSFFLISRGDNVSIGVGCAMLVSTLIGCGVAVFGKHFKLIDISSMLGLKS
ncbi:hypothetical protein N2605_23675 [Bradyrhizobium yuanmingense]|uniref:hypothetical protein n=1 Tax=Bradyrhizobium yuanmingense TaxID=108015 RepID=UPI0021A25FE8|nr:hypothetical protein [Bradyrhizobium sp. CB1024]UWU82596.1 hypothetical protein N2605_23675 [Bradyrhizobium sp. CB1024]